MAASFQPELDFSDEVRETDASEALILDLDGYEGPLHLLLALARDQKVDLLQISISRLADQYLALVHLARARRFALAADYLVMAAWLTYLKSRLLLPKAERPQAEEAPAEQMAGALAFRLARLDALRKAGEALASRPQLGRDVFVRGDPEAIRIEPSWRLEGDLHALMDAYVRQQRARAKRNYKPMRVNAYSLDSARTRLRRLAVNLDGWTRLDAILPDEIEAEGAGLRSRLASTLSASLEMVRERELHLHQDEAFTPVLIRRGQRKTAGAGVATNDEADP